MWGSGFRLCWFSLFPNIDDLFICTNMFSVFCEIDKLVFEKIEKEIFICNRAQYFAHKFTFKHKCNDDNILDVHGISASTTFRWTWRLLGASVQRGAPKNKQCNCVVLKVANVQHVTVDEHDESELNSRSHSFSGLLHRCPYFSYLFQFHAF